MERVLKIVKHEYMPIGELAEKIKSEHEFISNKVTEAFNKLDVKGHVFTLPSIFLMDLDKSNPLDYAGRADYDVDVYTHSSVDTVGNEGWEVMKKELDTSLPDLFTVHIKNVF